MRDLVFEAMTEARLQAVLEIYNYYVRHSTATWHYHALDEQEMKSLLLSEDSRYGTFVILDGGSLCGYVSIHRYMTREGFGDTAEISIYLTEACRGRGIGRAALGFIEGFAREKGLHVLMASISADNTGSVELFSRNGYEKCAHLREVGRKFGLILDNVLYQKILDT